MIDNMLFDDLGGFVLDIGTHSTGPAGRILFDTFMSWFVLMPAETSYTF